MPNVRPSSSLSILAVLGAALAATPAAGAPRPAAVKPLRALLVIGGCCHDYGRQKDLLKEGLEKRANVQVDVAYSPDTSTKCRFPNYEKPDWAKGYDVIIHDECSADVKDMPYVDNVLAPHKAGVPAVNLHCAVHSYRTGTEAWFAFLGLQSSAHGPQEPIAVAFLPDAGPITAGMAGFTTGKEELYNNVKLFETARPLARGKQTQRRKDGTTKDEEFVVAWTNDYGGTRVFSTTLGHNDALVEDERYLELVTRGLLWATGKLDDAGRPRRGYARTPAAAPKAAAR